MTDSELREFALREHDRMRIFADQMKQLGFKALAKFLNRSADDALKYAARPQEKA